MIRKTGNEMNFDEGRFGEGRRVDRVSGRVVEGLSRWRGKQKPGPGVWRAWGVMG